MAKRGSFSPKLSCLILALLLAVSGVAQTEIEVFVSSRGTNAVKKYDVNGNYLGNFISPGSGGLVATEDILFHPDGTILVTGAGNTAIKRYHGKSGQYLGDFSSGYALETPSKMSMGWDSLIYVTQWGTIKNKVVRFDLDGNFVDEFTQIPAPNGLGHFWDADKNFYIALYGNGASGTVHKFDSLGKSLGTFINSNVLQGPTSIWYDADGNILVEDWTVGKVFRYTSNGLYAGVFTTGLTNPEGIAFLPDGKLLIGDWGVDAVHLIDSTGKLLGLFTSGNGLSDPNSVKVRISTVTSTEEEVDPWAGLAVYPNPASDLVYLERVPEPFKAELFDQSGKLVFSKENCRTVDVGNLPRAVYVLKVIGLSSGRVSMVKRVVVH